MKRTSKVISIILSVFMLMQMMTGVVFASGKTKLGTPTNVKIAYDEGWEDYVYTFDAKVPSDENAYEYAVCVGGNVNGKIILAIPRFFSFEPEFLKGDIENDFSDWKEDMGVSDCEMLIGFLVVSKDEENYADSDITVVDAKANIKNVNASFGGKYNENTYWAYSNGTLTYFGGGEADDFMSDVNKNDVDTIIFESDIELVSNYFSFYSFPNVKNIYFLGTDTVAEDFLNQAPRTVAVFAHKNSAAYNLLINAGDRDDNGFYGWRIVCLDIDSADENYKSAPTNADAVKIMSDCGIIPQIYSMYDKNVTKAALAEALVRLQATTLYVDRDTLKYTDLTAGTFTNGCVNHASDWIAPKSETEFGANDEITYGELKTSLKAFTQEENIAQKIGLDGKNEQDKVTFDDLALIFLNLATFDFNPENEESLHLSVGELFRGSVTTRLEDNEWIATLNGKVTFSQSDTEDIENRDFVVRDSDLIGIDDDEITLFIDNDSVLSGYYSTYDIVKDGKVYKADFTINDGAAETNSKTVSIKLNAEGYTKYSIGGGSYKKITSSPISYTLDSKHGEQSVSVTFANDDLSKTKTVVKTIKLNNLHKVIYMVDGKEFATVLVGCGLEVPALDKTPVKEGYAFDGWENLPEIMPDKDITVNAKFVVEPPVAAGTFSANDKAKWSLSKDGTLYISGTGSASVVGGSGNEQADHVLEYMTDRAKAETIKKVVVGEGITDIGDYVLYELYNAEEITLPSTLKTIGKAFMKGSSVKNVVIPANVASVNMDWSFIKCENLESVYFLNKDIALNIPDESSSYQREINLYGYSDSSVKAYADAHSCTFVSIDPDFAINNGAAETTDKNVKISFNDYAKNDFKQYKINDGEYKNIDGNDIDFVLDSADGEKIISITFKNDSYEIEKTHKIIFNNKHKITYVSGDTIIDEATVGCGAKITATDKIASKEGYTFLGWDIPEIMPDSDVAANAIFAKNADSEQLDAILSDEEKADGISVKADISAAEENENIELALANKYSKYTASLIINIDISKGKDENFTPITETENLLTFTVDIPSEIQGKAEYIVLREHNGTVDALTTSKNADGEYIEVKDNTIIIHAKKFSAYQLIAKDADPTPSRRGGGGGGSSSLTVKFETNGAPSIKSVSVSRNNVITAPKAPVKDGFVFDGWYTDKNFATKFDFNTKITKSITLYAKWVEKATTSIILTIGQKDATIDGKTVSNDVTPKIVNDRTMLPIRFIAEALGAKVDWIEESQTVKITAENIDISLVIGEDFATVNGEKIDLDSPSFIENDRTYLPIRFVSEKLGADVKWDDTTQTVNITK